MAKKKSINYTPWIIGAGAVGILAYVFKDDIKNLFAPKVDDTNEMPDIPIIENVVTTNGVTPVVKSVTAGLSALGTPKDRLNMDIKLKFGDKGQEIAKLQQILNRIAKITGKPMVTEDGIWGSGTETRMKNLFTNLSNINLYKMYIALFAIYAANKGKQAKKWFDVYQTFLASDQLRNAARSEYFKNNAII